MVADELKLEWGTPATRATSRARGALARLKQRLCLHGTAGWSCGRSWRALDAFETYRSLPEGVRAALRVAAQAGCACDVGSHTSKDRSKYERRKTLATVRGAVTDEVAFTLTLAGFRRNALHERGGAQWWGYQ